MTNKGVSTISLFFLLAICLACIRFTEPSVVEEKQDVSKNNVEYPIIQNIEKEINIEVEPVIETIKEPIKEVTTPTLKTLAQDKINDLFSTGYWSHTNSNGCDYTCRTKPYWKYYSWIGENLYKGVCNKENAYRLWRTSPSHLEILNHPSTEEVILMQEYAPDKCYIVLEKGIIISH
jgi:thioesterase domain-containing protein